jgi:hypothetical protein
MKIQRHLLILSVFLVCTYSLHAQDEGFIYGKISTEDGKTYEGPIRWGKEEVYWVDMFNAAKERNENLKYLSASQRDNLDERQFSNWNNWSDNFGNWFARKTTWHVDYDNDYIHQFACQFGEIKVIRPMGKKYLEVEMQSGVVYELTGEGYNDVGLDIKIMDKEIGEVEVYWNRIEKIEFMNTPSKVSTKFGEPLYGTVQAYGEKFTGFIQWDKDERLSTDKLDGDSDDGDVSIEFSKIKEIERRGGRSEVTLKSGRKLLLDGSNDVSDGHRGVIIMNKDFASITVPWDEFENIVFEEKSQQPIATYNDFKTQKELAATVKTEGGKTFKGRLVYDLDETHDHELLQGKEGEVEYAIPFRNIKRITPKGGYRCMIEMKNGKIISLDEGQDVNERNQGVLVFTTGNSEPEYVEWDEVSEIEFN